MPGSYIDRATTHKNTAIKNVDHALYNKIFLQVFHIAYGLIYALVLTFSVELIQRGNIEDTLKWAKLFSTNFFLGYLLIASVFMLIYFITSRTWAASFITGLIFGGAALANYFKIIIRGDPFLPWDLKIGKEAGNILQYVDIEFTPILSFALSIIVLFALIGLLIKQTKLKWKVRLIMTLLISLEIGLTFTQIYVNSKTLQSLKIQDVNWDQVQNYERNGFLMGFLINVKSIVIQQPAKYSKKSLQKIVNTIPANNSNAQADGQKMPNIVMIMSEAFWDPTQFNNLRFSQDPIPTIRKLRKEAVSGWLLSPQFGGSTANPEFEALTGHSMAFLPYGSIAYEQYVKEPMPSLVSYLSNQGYYTVGIHPYVKWFWDREDVYPRLGFEKAIFNEDFEDPEIEAGYISDMSAVKEVIKQYEQNKEETGKPFFSFLVTMENHGTYEDKPYENRTISVTNNNLSEETQHILNNYVQGVKNADTALGYLIDYFEELDEPTVVVMFGDHLPTLGNKYSVYRELGYVKDLDFTAKEYVKLYTTPFVIWNNYDIKPENAGIMNTHYIAPYVLNHAGMEMPKYFRFLLNLKKEIPAYTSFVSLDENNVPRILPSKTMKLKKQQHWLLQYDIMFGKGYMEEQLFSK
jgi:phosphoglycerol transferase MdoB-like AlkP superfamily enzyme